MSIIAEAIRKAARLVIMDNYGNGQYRVRHYSHEHRAWWEGSICNRETALLELHTERINMALELLEIEDAAELANSCTYNAYPKDWRQCVRDEIRADKRARETT